MSDPTRSSASDPAAARRAVEALNSVFYEAIESADLDTMQDLWLDGPDTVCVHPGALPVRGTGPINRSWALVMASTPYIQYVLTDVEVSLRGTTASVTCTENVLTGDERAGVDSFGGGTAVASNVFLHTDAGWRLWIHHSSLVVPGGNDDDS